MELGIVISAILIGFAGSLHCAGMCGPLMLSALYDKNNSTLSVKRWVSYHAGRLSAYATWGMLFGMIGTSLTIFGWQQNISIALGVIIIITAISLMAFPNLEAIIGNMIFFRLLKEKLITKYGLQKKNNIFLKGILNGILPCGLVYMAMAGAIGMQNPFKGGLFMLLFGIGTLPVLFIVLIAGSKISYSLRKYFFAFYPYMILIIGLLLIIRGMNLGNYFSPALLKLENQIQCAVK